MSVRIPTAADAAAAVSLYNGSLTLMRSMFGGDWFPWDVAVATRIITHPGMRCYLYEVSGVPQGFIFISRRREHVGTLVFGQSGSANARRARAVAGSKEIGNRWAADCIADGKPQCSYSWAGSDVGYMRVQVFDKIEQGGMVRSDNDPAPGTVTWRGTPAQLTAGLALV